jgi:hypothetical protein
MGMGRVNLAIRTHRYARWHKPLSVTVAAAACLVMAGCSGSTAPTRSVKQFCDTYNSEKSKFQSKYAPLESGGTPKTAGGILTDLLMGFQSLGDATVILTKLDKVAPDDIEPDVAAVLDSWKGMQGTLGDEASNAFNPQGLIGAMLKGMLASVESNGSWTRVGNYVQQHCIDGQ